MALTNAAAALAAAALFSGGLWLGVSLGAAGEERLAADWARERERLAGEHAAALAAALSRERQLAREMADAGEHYEQELRNARKESDRVAADLRGNVLRLRQRWAGCETRHLSATPPAARQPDAAAADRADSAGRIVRAADQCDAQVKALQALLMAERKAEAANGH
jgi:hypothetical protein